jgi:hypothetical protein
MKRLAAQVELPPRRLPWRALRSWPPVGAGAIGGRGRVLVFGVLAEPPVDVGLGRAALLVGDVDEAAQLLMADVGVAGRALGPSIMASNMGVLDRAGVRVSAFALSCLSLPSSLPLR